MFKENPYNQKAYEWNMSAYFCRRPQTKVEKKNNPSLQVFYVKIYSQRKRIVTVYTILFIADTLPGIRKQLFSIPGISY